MPVRVDYRLTQRGQGLIKALHPLARWSEENSVLEDDDVSI